MKCAWSGPFRVMRFEDAIRIDVARKGEQVGVDLRDPAALGDALAILNRRIATWGVSADEGDILDAIERAEPVAEPASFAVAPMQEGFLNG